MNPQTISDDSMTRDHERWEADHVGWLRDVARWARAIEVQLDEVERKRAALIDHAAALRHHAEEIVGNERTLVTHAREMRRPRDPGQLDPMTICHCQMGCEHTRVGEVHRRLKRTQAALLQPPAERGLELP